MLKEKRRKSKKEWIFLGSQAVICEHTVVKVDQHLGQHQALLLP